MLTDDKNDYGWISIALHWVSAILVLVLFFNGRGLEADPEPAQRMDLIATHLSVGGIALMVLTIRFGWRLRGGIPGGHLAEGLLDKLSVALLWLLVSTVLLLALTGLIAQWAAGDPMPLAAGVSLPSPMGRQQELATMMLQVHDIAAAAILPLFLLHILANMRFVMKGQLEVVMRMVRVRSTAD